MDNATHFIELKTFAACAGLWLIHVERFNSTFPHVLSMTWARCQ